MFLGIVLTGPYIIVKVRDLYGWLSCFLIVPFESQTRLKSEETEKERDPHNI